MVSAVSINASTDDLRKHPETKGGSMIILGIDPGASGAISAVDGDGRFIESCRLDATESDIARWLRGIGTGSFAFIERVHSMPKQGVSSSFKFGQSYGFLRGLLAAREIPFEEVTPQKWQKEMGCLSKGNKNVTKQRAGQLFPGMKWTHATADSVLIAEYGRRTLAARVK